MRDTEKEEVKMKTNRGERQVGRRGEWGYGPCECTHSHRHSHTHTTYTYINTHTHTLMHALTQTHAHTTYTQTHTHVHTHTHTRVFRGTNPDTTMLFVPRWVVFTEVLHLSYLDFKGRWLTFSLH